MLRSLLLCVAFASVGCSGSNTPSASDPAAGKETLRKVLDAWKGGESYATFKAANPSLTVVILPWEKGVKLTEYTIDDKSDMNGYDVKFTVRETTSDGKKAGEKATYNVSTTPKVVVIRAEPGM
jgi:hypothetical protein